jgi:hypothetical protein
MNEGSLNMTHELAKVAGVTLSVPQMSYTVEYEPGKIAELRRDGWNQWERLRWTLTLHEKNSGQPELKQATSSEGTISFSLNEFRGYFCPAERFRFRELLVDFYLFSNPDALIGPRSSTKKASTSPLAPEISNDIKQLSDHLHKQLALKGAYHRVAQCDRCKKSETESIEALDFFWSGIRSKQVRSGSYNGDFLKQDCIHAEPARKALDKVCRKFPSIIFELCGLIVPERPAFVVDSDSKAQDKTLPTRFVLDKDCALAMANHWLRAVRTNQTEHGYRYGFMSQTRRFYSSSVRVSIPRAIDGEGGMPANLREAIVFSASGYKIDQEAEALAMGELTGEATFSLECQSNALPVSTLIVLPEERAGVTGTDNSAAGDQARVVKTAARAKATKLKNKQKLATITK